MRVGDSLGRRVDRDCSVREGADTAGVVNGCGLALTDGRAMVSREGDTGRERGVSIVETAG